jgi:phosphoglucan, water dikinase
MLFIGNQSSCWTPSLFEPFDFALAQGFNAFEWFPDKKPTAGWDNSDLDAQARERIRNLAQSNGVRLSVHARCQANPLESKGQEWLQQDLQLATGLGAVMLNIHLFEEKGIAAFVQSLIPLIEGTDRAGVELSIENTPHHAPELFNELFARLRASKGFRTEHVGMCLDIGHANLAAATRNDYIAFFDRLDATIPITHLHLHENWGDMDSHLPLFTGPASKNDSGIRSLLERLKNRNYAGSMILEQWPQPPSLLCDSRGRLISLWGPEQSVSAAAPKQTATSGKLSRRAPVEADLSDEIAKRNQHARSWREKLELVAGILAERQGSLSNLQLVEIAVYLRFLGTGEISCAEDGHHFRPAHHARLAANIFETLFKLTSDENAFILRKIYPWLPSFDPTFRRAEPLTRIRDIAHRNDIDSDLKREIKTTLQNKLHRCAGPEDLVTSTALLNKITAAGTHYSKEFVEQFELFHDELREFFNATSLEQRLANLKALFRDPAQISFVQEFLTSKDAKDLTSRLPVLVKLTALRRTISARLRTSSGEAAQSLMLADISLEDYAFVPLSRLINDSEALGDTEAFRARLEAASFALENLALSSVEPAESLAIKSELVAWGNPSRSGSRAELLRLRATLLRSRRLAENFGRTIIALFSERVEKLGHLLGVPPHAIKVYCEGDIRSHLVFQISKLADALLKQTRGFLQLPPWDTVVPGKAAGKAVVLSGFSHSPAIEHGQTIAIVQRAEGDEDIPPNVVGIALAHEIPHLAHLSVRARQAGVVFVTCEEPAEFARLEQIAGKGLLLTAEPDKVGWTVEQSGQSLKSRTHSTPVLIQARLDAAGSWLGLDQAAVAFAGAKAAGARRLFELAQKPDAGFRAPDGMVIPFGVMERALTASPELAKKYSELMEQLAENKANDIAPFVAKFSNLVRGIQMPRVIQDEVKRRFGTGRRLAVRSSSNTEDLEQFAGAGLHESVINILPDEVDDAIKRVWASLWTGRAIQSRRTAGICHADAHMAVLIQELVSSEFSFVLHTTNPVSQRSSELHAEIVVGLGETLVSAEQAGTPYRLKCEKQTNAVEILAFANFSQALVPETAGGTRKETVDYSKIRLSNEPRELEEFGRRLISVATRIEQAMGSPQDIEGVEVKGQIFLVQSRAQQGLSSVHRV